MLKGFTHVEAQDAYSSKEILETTTANRKKKRKKGEAILNEKPVTGIT